MGMLLLLLLFMLAAASKAWTSAFSVGRSSVAHRASASFRTSTVCRLNRILFEASEITNHTTVVIAKDDDMHTEEELAVIPVVEIPKDDYRTIHVAKILSLPNGATLRSGIVSCDMYPEGLTTDSATIEWLPEGKVKKRAPLGNGKPPGSLRVHLQSLATPSPTQRPNVSLILALPRPLQLGRLLPVIASMGCDELFLIGAAKVPRDYWGSHLFRSSPPPSDNNSTSTPSAITALLTEGLAQSGDTRLPRVHLYKGPLQRFLQKYTFPHHTRLVAHPTRSDDQGTTSAVLQSHRIREAVPLGQRRQPIVVAVGPEGGWEEPDELDLWTVEQKHAFTPVTLGHRVLRTDTAVVSLLALAQDAYDAAAAAEDEATATVG